MEVNWKKFQEFLMEEPKLDGGLAGISIRSRLTGELLYEHMGDIRLHPASNMKLFTCAAGLSVLGENYTFPTEILVDGETEGKRLIGNLYLKGKGDPTLLQPEFEMFANVLKEIGIMEIVGDVIGDDSWYDDVRLSKDLNWSDEHYYYGSQVSALTASPNEDYDSGTVMLKFTPGTKEGDQPLITLIPNTEYIQIINKAITTNPEMPSTEPDITIIRKHGTNLVIVEGSIPILSDPLKEWVAVWEPTDYAMDLFKIALTRNGIRWTGDVTKGVTPKQAKPLYTHHSIPLTDLCIPFMKLSNNGHGEILVKEMGRVVKGEGSWECGLEVLNTELEKLGVDTTKLLIRDGSGISHVTLIPPNELSKFLFTIQEEKWFSHFCRSLPVTGQEDRMVGGTLCDRMIGLKVNAKTGTIMGVSTLSGYLTTNSGEELIFSIILNNLLDEEDGPDIIDRLVGFIAG